MKWYLRQKQHHPPHCTVLPYPVNSANSTAHITWKTLLNRKRSSQGKLISDERLIVVNNKILKPVKKHNVAIQRQMQAPRGGLARYRSAPASWLETLLESDEEQSQTRTQAQKHSEVVLEIPEPPPPTSTARDEDDDGDINLELLGVGSGGLSNFLRQNSSPAEFLSLISGGGADSEGYFGNLGYPADYDSASPLGKRAREAEDWDKVSPKMSSSTSGSAAAATLKREKSSEFPGGIGEPLNAEMEKLFEDSVMCRVRAKRGCATHPRSIAERVRRTRISDRIRKLQELVPNMNKQTNTADMLDEAVAYVKFLQQQIQEITEQQKNCKCSPNK